MLNPLGFMFCNNVGLFNYGFCLAGRMLCSGGSGRVSAFITVEKHY